MVFEQAYGRWLVSELNSKIKTINSKLVCKLYDEVGYKPLYNAPDEIAVVISGGNASRSSVKGLDQNVLPLTITVICKELYSTPVRNAIDSLQRQYNAVPQILEYYDGVEDDKKSTFAKSIYTTPFIFNESDYHTKYETVKAVFISFSASVIYGDTAVVEPADAVLSIGETDYPITHIAECNSASVPSYEAYLPQGADRASQSAISRVNTFSYTLYKVAGDELQAILENELACKAGGLNGKKLYLDAGGGKTEVKTYQLNDHYVNNAAAYVLTLGV